MGAVVIRFLAGCSPPGKTWCGSVGISITTGFINGAMSLRSSAETFAVGDVVEANYRGQGHWYPGRIASLDLDGYKIAYDDGENESEVATANVRRAAAAPAPVPPPAAPGGYVDAVLTAPPASATEIAHSEAQRMFGEAPKPQAPAEPASTVITPPATQSRPQLDDEKERLRLERDAARRELEALKAQLAAQAPQSA